MWNGAMSDKPYLPANEFHGFGDNDAAWTEVRRAHLIAGNLLAAAKIHRCVIALPLGDPVSPPFGSHPGNYS